MSENTIPEHFQEENSQPNWLGNQYMGLGLWQCRNCNDWLKNSDLIQGRCRSCHEEAAQAILKDQESTQEFHRSIRVARVVNTRTTGEPSHQGRRKNWGRKSPDREIEACIRLLNALRANPKYNDKNWNHDRDQVMTKLQRIFGLSGRLSDPRNWNRIIDRLDHYRDDWRGQVKPQEWRVG